MTKQEALSRFRKLYSELLNVRGKQRDEPMIREAWNNFTDYLCKNREITSHQYDTWTNPF